MSVSNVNLTNNHVTNGIFGHGDLYPADGSSFTNNGGLYYDSNRTAGGNSDYTQYMYDGTVFLSKLFYVSSDGAGSGLTEDNPTTMDIALRYIDIDGKIILVDDCIFDKYYNITGANNITITGNKKIKSNTKYLFIEPKTDSILTVNNATLITY